MSVVRTAVACRRGITRRGAGVICTESIPVLLLLLLQLLLMLMLATTSVRIIGVCAVTLLVLV